jgi:hypothetical protein
MTYSSEGIEALLCLSSGRGRKDHLSKKAQEELLTLIDEPQHNRQGERLGGVDIQGFIKEMYGVDYTLSGIYTLLIGLDFPGLPVVLFILRWMLWLKNLLKKIDIYRVFNSMDDITKAACHT